MDRADEIWGRTLTRRHLLTVAAGSAGMAFVGCGDDDDGGGELATGSQATEKQPVKGGTLTLMEGLGSNTGVGPAITEPKAGGIALGSADAWGLVSVPLLRFDWMKGQVYDGVAEKWEFPDPTTLILTLKKNTHFQQQSLGKGRELDSSDVVATLERTRTPGDATWLAVTRFRLVDTYEAIDKYTVRVKFKQPDANYLSHLYIPTTGITFPKEAVQKYPGSMAGQAEIWGTNGPFIPDMSTFKDGVSCTFRRNPTYDVDPGGLPYLDAINIIGIPDTSLQTAALRSGEVDIGIIPVLDRKSFESNFTIGSTEDTITAVSQMDMNTTMPPFNDPRVRQAIHRVIDREALKQVVGEGFACTAIILGCRSSLYLTEKEWDGKPGFRKDKAQDITEAKQLLSAAGVDPTKLPTFLHVNDAPGAAKVRADQGVAITGQLRQALGLNTTTRVDISAAPSQDQVRANNIALNTNSNGGLGGLLWDDPLQIANRTTGAQNGSLHKDTKVDELIDKQQTTLDLNERKKIWAELQRYLVNTDQTASTMYSAPMTRNYDFWGAKKNVRNWQVSGYFLSHYPWQFNKVWIDK